MQSIRGRQIVTSTAAVARIGPPWSFAVPARRAQTDRQLLAIIITNLIENASKYSASDSTIGVGIHVNMEKGVVRLDVRNRPGTAGWPDPDRVFEKYYRSAHARRQTGTGLGLFIVMNLAKALDIEIHYSPDEHFVRFVLEIPC